MAATRKSPWEKRTSWQKMATSTTIGTTWQQYPAEGLDDLEEKADLETYLAGESDWIHRDLSVSDTLDSYVEGECSDKNLYDAYLWCKEARDTLNQVRRGRGFWHVITIPVSDGRSVTMAVWSNVDRFLGDTGKDRKGTTHRDESKARVENVTKLAREAEARVLPQVRVTL